MFLYSIIDLYIIVIGGIFMFFAKQKEQAIGLKIDKNEGEINISTRIDVERQLKMIHLTIEDLQYIKALQPYVMAKIDEVVERFYENLHYEASLLEIINRHSSIDKLKKTLKQHIIEMFDGVVNDDYFEKRLKIAHIHLKIGLQTKWYMCAFQDLQLSLLEIIEELPIDKKTDFQTIKAVTKILNLEQQLVLEAYDAENERLKSQIESQKSMVRSAVAAETENLAAISEETNASFQELIAQSNEVVIHAEKGTDYSMHAKENAEDGKSHIHKQVLVMSDIQYSVKDIKTDIEGLLEVLGQMQDITEIVTDISNQTNLLSLNAAIEAARAGEAGRGFSVVAGEVRKLSDQTKKSVENVSSLIVNTNDQIDKLTKSLEKVSEDVENGHIYMKSTEGHFEQIVKTMEDTMLQNNKIKNEITDIVEVIHILGKSFQEVAYTAENLTCIAQDI